MARLPRRLALIVGVPLALTLVTSVPPARGQNRGGQDGVAAVNQSSLHQPDLRIPAARPANNPEGREAVRNIAEKFKGTHDIAGAAEFLVNLAGSQFNYDYGNPNDPARRDFASIRNLDDLYAQRLMICYEFVHYVAYLASNQRTAGDNPMVGSSAASVYNWRDYEVWDGESDIPRGKIVVFRAYAFNNDSGYYHVGISLGNGKIAHNSSGGSVQISDISDVNSLGYEEVRISDYNWRSAGDRNPGEPEPEAGEPPAEPTIGHIRRGPLRKALDAAPPGIRAADKSTCCGDPLGKVLTPPALAVTSKFQVFVTGETMDVQIGAGGSQDRRDVAARAPLDSAIDLLSWLLRGAVATLEARQQPGPGIGVAVVSTGNSTGDVFVLQVQGDLASPSRMFANDALVLEPTTQIVAMPSPAAGRLVSPLEGYCAEFAKDPPPRGTVYRVAPARAQERLAPMRAILRQAGELAAAGKLHPDTDAAGYLNFIKQYAMWTRLERWDRNAFMRNFVARTKKNAESQGRRWTDAAERQLRSALPGRWADIQVVLQSADAASR